MPGWRREYGKIVNRFERTVTAQFHGHTHDDWFIVYHNEEGEPSNTAFVAPSGTSYTDRNPEFRVYSVVDDQVHIKHFTTFYTSIFNARTFNYLINFPD